MLKIVLDTNILLSSVSRYSPSAVVRVSRTTVVCETQTTARKNSEIKILAYFCTKQKSHENLYQS